MNSASSDGLDVEIWPGQIVSSLTKRFIVTELFGPSTDFDDHVITTHRNLCDLIKELKIPEVQRKEKRTLQVHLLNKYPYVASSHAFKPERLGNSIDLAFRLYLMCDVRNPDTCDAVVPGAQSVNWAQDQSMIGFVEEWFQAPVPNPGNLRNRRAATRTTQFSTLFSAPNMTRLAGFQILWTDNLLDHLSFDESNKNITVFHHVSVLRHLSTSSTPAIAQLANETLSSLSLLFPQTDVLHRSWDWRVSRQISKGTAVDQQLGSLPVISPAGRTPEKFPIWNEDLLRIHAAFNDSEPGTLTQWWYDRRNRVQWATFWTAVLILLLTVLFGLVQSITGIISAWAAIRALSI